MSTVEAAAPDPVQFGYVGLDRAERCTVVEMTPKAVAIDPQRTDLLAQKR